MDKPEYVISLYAILFGFNLALFLEGWILFFYRTSKYKIYQPYLGWTVACFLVIIQYWWSVYDVLNKNAAINSLHFIAFLIPVLFQYVLTALLFNRSILNGESDLGKYAYLKSRKKEVNRKRDLKLIVHMVAYKKPLFFTAIAYVICMTVLNMIYAEPQFPSLIPTIARSFVIPILIWGFYNKSERFHAFIAWSLVVVVLFIAIYRYFQGA